MSARWHRAGSRPPASPASAMNSGAAARQQHQRSLPSNMTRAQLAADRDAIQKRIASALLVVAEPHSPVKAPVIVLQVSRL